MRLDFRSTELVSREELEDEGFRRSGDSRSHHWNSEGTPHQWSHGPRYQLSLRMLAPLRKQEESESTKTLIAFFPPLRQVSLHSPACPRICSVDSVGVKLKRSTCLCPEYWDQRLGHYYLAVFFVLEGNPNYLTTHNL